MIDVAAARLTGTGMVRFVSFTMLAGVMLAAGPNEAYAQDASGATGKATRAVFLKNDILVDRSSQGLWVRRNNVTWQRLDTGNPTAIAVGDIDGDGKDDIVYGMNRPGRVGTFVRFLTNPAPINIDIRPATRIAVGDFDGDGNSKQDLLVTFQGTNGTFLWSNNHPAPLGNSNFFQVDPGTGVQVAVGDLEGDNIADAILALPMVIKYCDNAMNPWIPIRSGPINNVVVGDFNADGRDDLIADQAATGVWRSMDGGQTWSKINNRNPTVLATGDADGNGSDGVFASFPNPNGGLFTSPNATATPAWVRIYPRPLSIIAAGRLDNNAKEDILIVDPSNPNVILVRRNNTGAFSPLPMPPGAGAPVQGIVFGAFD